MIRFKQFISESLSISLPEQAKRRAIQNRSYINVDVNDQTMVRDMSLPQWDLTLSIDPSKHNVQEIVEPGGRLYHPVELSVRLIPKRYSIGPEFGYFYHMMLSTSLLSNQMNPIREPYSHNEELGRYQNSGEAYFTYLMHLMQPIISYLNSGDYHGRVIFFTHFDLDIPTASNNARYLRFVLEKDLDDYYREMTGMESFKPLTYPSDLGNSRWYTNESGLYLNYGHTGSTEKIFQSNRARPLPAYRESVARIGNETRDDGGPPSDEELERRMRDRMIARGREMEPDVSAQGAAGRLPQRGGKKYSAADIDDIIANIDKTLRGDEECDLKIL